MDEFKKEYECVVNQFSEGCITEREGLARLAAVAADAWGRAPKGEFDE